MNVGTAGKRPIGVWVEISPPSPGITLAAYSLQSRYAPEVQVLAGDGYIYINPAPRTAFSLTLATANRYRPREIHGPTGLDQIYGPSLTTNGSRTRSVPPGGALRCVDLEKHSRVGETVGKVNLPASAAVAPGRVASHGAEGPGDGEAAGVQV